MDNVIFGMHLLSNKISQGSSLPTINSGNIGHNPDLDAKTRP